MNRLAVGCVSSRTCLTLAKLPIKQITVRQLSFTQRRPSPLKWMKEKKKEMAQYGGLFLFVKGCHFFPLMYILSYCPQLFGHETPTDWIFSMNWVKKIADYFNFDINHHLQVDENTQLPLPIRLIERAGFETNPYFHTPTFMVDFLALFFVYEFVIAPVKWPYYFWATTMIYRAPYTRFPAFAVFWISACMLTKTFMKKSN